MKKSMLWAVAAVMFVGLGAQAGMQCPADGGCDAKLEAKLQKMTKELGLDADQQAKVKAVLEKKCEQKCAAKKETGDKIEAIKTSAQGDIRTILTKKQQATFDKMMAEGTACCAMAGQKGHKCPAKKTACCSKAGEKGHKCPMGKEKAAACCPMDGKSKK